MKQEPIAIIGIGCRFPGAENVAAFWRLLCEGRDEIREFPLERSRLLGTSIDPSFQAGFLEGIDQFDAQFFGISPQEAITIDPQQRLLLEVTWQALEDAGQIPAQLAESQVGVFTAVTEREYLQFLLAHQALGSVPSEHLGSAITANRISYFFDLRGISLAINTACSSALVAVDRACRSLWNEEISMAIVGGASLILMPSIQSKMLSAQGRCKPFDATADGYVQGEGIGVVILKPLSQALRDRDAIYAVIRGSAVNQDGRSNGLTAPSPQAQRALLKAAYTHAGIDPSTIDYVEAHASGTLIGDALELNTLGDVLAADRSFKNPCAIASVKTNLGHLETASGIASLIKVALALKHQEIPAHLHFQAANPYVAFEHLAFVIPTTSMPFPQRQHPSRAAVSAFGLGGTNAHVILEAVAELPSQAIETSPNLLTLSAKSESALRALVQGYLDCLHDQPNLADLCFTLNTRRTRFPYRMAIVASSIAQVQHQMQCFLQNQPVEGLFVGKLDATLDRQKSLSEHLINLGYQDEIQQLEPLDSTLEQAIFSAHSTWSSTLQQSLLQLWIRGIDLNWASLYSTTHRCLLSLPTYPFERRSFWLTADPNCDENVPLRPAFAAPRTATEQKLASIWAEVLSHGESLNVGQHDNFFALGGDSLKATQIMVRINQLFEIELPLVAIFQSSTLIEQAKKIDDFCAESSALMSLFKQVQNLSETECLALFENLSL